MRKAVSWYNKNMHIDHPAFVNPKDNKTKLWRYIEIQKYMHLVESSMLYFCRADLYRKEDPFEGTFPKIEYEYSIKHSGEVETKNLYRITSMDTFLSCWHLNNEESLAMWKLYSQMDKGVAIQTDIKNFKEAFSLTNKKIFSGVVQYINYETDTYYTPSKHPYYLANAFTAYIHKRKIFEYENEYRAICTDPNGKDKLGFGVEVDLTKLIQRVLVAPNTPEWLFTTVKSITDKYKGNLEICRSSYDLKPYC
jgi:hypothetical protein